jgi:hypothetical protein
MNVLSLIVGIGLTPLGLWLTVVKFKYLNSGKPDSLGGHISLLLVGIALVVYGVMELAKHF